MDGAGVACRLKTSKARSSRTGSNAVVTIAYGESIDLDNPPGVSAPPPRYSQNLISPPDSRLKQALNRPVFLLAKSPDSQPGPIAGFPVTLLAKKPETGRSGSSGNRETGFRLVPDGSFLPIRAGESTDSQKKIQRMPGSREIVQPGK